MQELQQKIRRSSRLLLSDTFRDYLAYASMVSDEDEVYTYMEQNKIGTDQPEFWVARLNYHRNRAQYFEFIELLKKTKQPNMKLDLKKSNKYYLLQQIENETQKQLERVLRKKIKGRRSARQYQILSLTKIERQTRKIGNIQIYVDPDCRYNYRLEDLVEFVQQRLQDQCQLIRNTYIRKNAQKPQSFIRKASNNIQKWSQELIHPQRHSINPGRISLNNIVSENRKSIVGRQSTNLQTPNFNKRSSKKAKSLSKIQSIQILKKIKNQRQQRANRTPPQRLKQQVYNPEQDLQLELQSSQVTTQRTQSINKQNKQIVRGKHQQQIDDRVSSKSDQSQISFKKQCIQKKDNLNYRKDNQVQNSMDPNNIAFIDGCGSKYTENQQQQYTNSLKDLLLKNSDSNMTLDRQLKETIKEIQLQRNQSQQTYSQIDSNKQNNGFLYEIDSQLQIKQPIKHYQIDSEEIRQRRILKTIFKKSENSNCSELSDKTSSLEAEQSAGLVYQELLECMSGKKTENVDKMIKKQGLSEKQRINLIYPQSQKIQNTYKSAKDNQKIQKTLQPQQRIDQRIAQTGKKYMKTNISRISQEKSYSHSEAKYKPKKTHYPS